MSETATDDGVEELVRKVREATGKKTRGRGRNSAQAVLTRAVDAASLFLNEDGTPFASFDVNGHRETHAVDSRGFRNHLIVEYYKEKREGPSGDKLREVVNLAVGRAHAEGRHAQTWLRVGWGEDGAHYLDLGTDDWRAVRTDADGWRVVDNPPIRFRRSGRERPLPVPVSSYVPAPGGGFVLDDRLMFLSSLVHLGGDGDDADAWRAQWRLLLGAVFDMLRPGTDHFITCLIGHAGSAKTAGMEIVTGLVDPREPSHTGMPRDPRDLMVAASARSVLAIDNASRINAEMADGLCRVSTGAGNESRELYTSGEVFVTKACCPTVITSLETISSRDDFQRRCINLHLPVVPASECLSREDVRMIADELRAGMLGQLLDAVSMAIRRRDAVNRELEGRLPAMADPVVWVESAAPLLGLKRGEFFEAYRLHKQRGVADAADSDDLVRATVALLRRRQGQRFEGGARALLDELVSLAPEDPPWLPGAPRYLGERLDSKVAMLTAAGVTYRKKVDARNHSTTFVLELQEERAAGDEGRAHAEAGLPF